MAEESRSGLCFSVSGKRKPQSPKNSERDSSLRLRSVRNDIRTSSNALFAGTAPFATLTASSWAALGQGKPWPYTVVAASALGVRQLAAALFRVSLLAAATPREAPRASSRIESASKLAHSKRRLRRHSASITAHGNLRST